MKHFRPLILALSYLFLFFFLTLFCFKTFSESRSSFNTLRLKPQNQPSAALSIKGDMHYNSGSVELQVFDGSAWSSIQTSAATSQPDSLLNLGISVAISSNQLVVTLTQADGVTAPTSGSPASVSFRNSTITSGGFSSVDFTATNVITLEAQDSIGVPDAGVIHVYLISDTTAEMCLSATLLDETSLHSATALTAGAEVTFSTLYCAGAHTSKPIRLIGELAATWSNPNWGSITKASNLVRGPPRSMVRVHTSNGYGSSSTVIRRFTTVVDDFGGDITYLDSATLGGTFTINTPGVYAITYTEIAGSTFDFGISLNSTQLTTVFNSITTADKLVGKRHGTNNFQENAGWSGYLNVGDVIRPHGEAASASSSTSRVNFTVVKVSN